MDITNAGLQVQTGTITTGGGNHQRRAFAANVPVANYSVDGDAYTIWDGGSYAGGISYRAISGIGYQLNFHVASTVAQGTTPPPKIMYLNGECTNKGRLVLTNACNGINFGDTVSRVHTLDDYED